MKLSSFAHMIEGARRAKENENSGLHYEVVWKHPDAPEGWGRRPTVTVDSLSKTTFSSAVKERLRKEMLDCLCSERI